MSIATELTALAENRDAIKAAILSKRPKTLPGNGLSSFPAAIASLDAIDDIISTVEKMDGLSHTGDTRAQIVSAILHINRMNNRLPAPQGGVEPDYHPDAGKTAFVVRVFDDGEHGLQFTIGGWTMKTGSSTVTVDWGDGTTSTSSDNGTVRLTHTYSSDGYYMVQISDDVKEWFPHFESPNGSYFNSVSGLMPQNAWSKVVVDGRTDGTWHVRNILKIHRALQWGDSITSTYCTYNGCVNLTGSVPRWPSGLKNAYSTYRECYGISGIIPDWPEGLTTATATYLNCTGLTGSIPDWPDTVTTAESTYAYCGGLTGSVPEWGASITTCNQTYNSCYGLTGRVPAWNSVTTNAYATFRDCPGLTGEIPSWGIAITNASQTYSGCSGLSGAVPEWTSSITDASSTFYNCQGLTGNVPDWGVAITNASGTYNSCYGLTGQVPEWTDTITNSQNTYYKCYNISGIIPEWGSAITNANSTFMWCYGLEGVWVVEEGGTTRPPTDAELMPSTITNKTNCVMYSSDAVRNLFLTTWGGTRAS